MEPKANNSFIPKQPLSGRKRRRQAGGGSAFGRLAAIVFLLALFGSLAMYGWHLLLEREIEGMEEELSAQRKAFEPARIARYKRLDDRLRAASTVLAEHRASGAVFQHLSDVTLERVQLSAFSYGLNDGEEGEEGAPVSSEFVITMKGATDSFETVALQKYAFEESEFFSSVSFSDFAIDKETGTVTFSVSLGVEPALVNFIEVTRRTDLLLAEDGESEEAPQDNEDEPEGSAEEEPADNSENL